MRLHETWIKIGLFLCTIVCVNTLRGTEVILRAKLNDSKQNLTVEQENVRNRTLFHNETDDSLTEQRPKLTGIPQIDYIHDPNLPRELNGYNLSNYPFYNKIPSGIEFQCDGLHDGFYASVPHKCQVYHHCLFGIRYDFLCANYTAFDQKTFICHFVSEVDCINSPKYYKRNEALYKAASTLPPPTTTTKATTTTPLTTTEGFRNGNNKRRKPSGGYRRRRPQYEYYDDDYEDYYEDDLPPRKIYNRRKKPSRSRIRDDYEYEEEIYEKKPRTTSTTEAPLPTSIVRSVYERPRMPPKVRRPVPINERDKYEYSTTSNPNRNHRTKDNRNKGQQDDYYDDYEEEIPTPKRRLKPETSRKEVNRRKPQIMRRPSRYDDEYEDESIKMSSKKINKQNHEHRSRDKDEDYEDDDTIRYTSDRHISRKRYQDKRRVVTRRPERYRADKDFEYYDEEPEQIPRTLSRGESRNKDNKKYNRYSNRNEQEKLPVTEVITTKKYEPAVLLKTTTPVTEGDVEYEYYEEYEEFDENTQNDKTKPEEESTTENKIKSSTTENSRTTQRFKSRISSPSVNYNLYSPKQRINSTTTTSTVPTDIFDEVTPKRFRPSNDFKTKVTSVINTRNRQSSTEKTLPIINQKDLRPSYNMELYEPITTMNPLQRPFKLNYSQIMSEYKRQDSLSTGRESSFTPIINNSKSVVNIDNIRKPSSETPYRTIHETKLVASRPSLSIKRPIKPLIEDIDDPVPSALGMNFKNQFKSYESQSNINTEQYPKYERPIKYDISMEYHKRPSKPKNESATLRPFKIISGTELRFSTAPGVMIFKRPLKQSIFLNDETNANKKPFVDNRNINKENDYNDFFKRDKHKLENNSDSFLLPKFPKELPKRIELTAPGPSAPDSDNNYSSSKPNSYSSRPTSYDLNIPDEEYDVTLNDALQPSTLHPSRNVDSIYPKIKTRGYQSSIEHPPYSNNARSPVTYLTTQQFFNHNSPVKESYDNTPQGTYLNPHEYETVVVQPSRFASTQLHQRLKRIRPREWYWK